MALTLAQIAKASVNAQIAYCLDKQPTYDAALAEEIEALVEAPLLARIAELERLCDSTYVANGADAYNHACSEMERWQEERARAEKEVGTEGSLCDGMAWLYQALAEKEARIAALTAQVEQAAQPVARKVAECLSVLRPIVKNKFPQQQALEELASYTAPPKAVPLNERVGLLYVGGSFDGELGDYDLVLDDAACDKINEREGAAGRESVYALYALPETAPQKDPL